MDTRAWQHYALKSEVGRDVGYIKTAEQLGFVGALTDRIAPQAFTKVHNPDGTVSFTDSEGNPQDLAMIQQLLQNTNPKTEQQLRQKRSNHERSAVQMTFALPKGVSLMAQYDESLRDEFLTAVQEVISSDIEPMMQVRKKQDGHKVDVTTGNLVGYLTRDNKTRPVNGIADPHETVDFYIINATEEPESKNIMATQMYQIMQRVPDINRKVEERFLQKLHDKGYETARQGPGWDLLGSREVTLENDETVNLTKHFSRRQKQIEDLASLYEQEFESAPGKATKVRFAKYGYSEIEGLINAIEEKREAKNEAPLSDDEKDRIRTFRRQSKDEYTLEESAQKEEWQQRLTPEMQHILAFQQARAALGIDGNAGFDLKKPEMQQTLVEAMQNNTHFAVNKTQAELVVNAIASQQKKQGPNLNEAIDRAKKVTFDTRGALSKERFITEVFKQLAGSQTKLSSRDIEERVNLMEMNGELITLEYGARQFIISAEMKEQMEKMETLLTRGNGPAVSEQQVERLLGNDVSAAVNDNMRTPIKLGFDIAQSFAEEGKDDFLNAGQRQAILNTLESTARYQMWVGRAGTGKTTAVEQVKKAVEQSADYNNLFATSPTAAQTKRLMEDGFNMPLPDDISEDRRKALEQSGVNLSQMMADLKKDPNYAKKFANSVLVVDEAWLKGDVKTSVELMELAERQNMKLIFLGDPKQKTFQTGSTRDNAFTMMMERQLLPVHYLEKVVRQKVSEAHGDLYQRIAETLVNDVERAFEMASDKHFEWEAHEKRQPDYYSKRKNLRITFVEDTGVFKAGTDYTVHTVETDNRGKDPQIYLREVNGDPITREDGELVPLPLAQVERYTVTEKGLNSMADIADEGERLNKLVEQYEERGGKIVAFYHEDRRNIMNKLREKWREEGKLKGDEHELVQKIEAKTPNGGRWSRAYNNQAEYYESGMQITLNKRVNKNMEVGTNYEVNNVTQDGRVLLKNARGETHYYDADKQKDIPYELPLQNKKFMQNYVSVHGKDTIRLALGDEIRFTKNKTFEFTNQDGTKRSESFTNNSGVVYRVTNFEKDKAGQVHTVEVENSKGHKRFFPADAGFIDYATVNTTVSAQGQTTDYVHIYLGDAIKYNPASGSDPYVAITRAREGFQLYSPDRSVVLDSIQRTQEAIGASDVLREGQTPERPLTAIEQKMQALAEQYQQLPEDKLRQHAKNLKNTLRRLKRQHDRVQDNYLQETALGTTTQLYEQDYQSRVIKAAKQCNQRMESLHEAMLDTESALELAHNLLKQREKAQANHHAETIALRMNQNSEQAHDPPNQREGP